MKLANGLRQKTLKSSFLHMVNALSVHHLPMHGVTKLRGHRLGITASLIILLVNLECA